MALILLVIISFAGLLAARHSATFEQFSNNMRTNQVSRVAAEDALRQCERIAKDSADGGASFPLQVGRIVATPITADTVTAIQAGVWNTHVNWAAGAPNLITITPEFDNTVQTTTLQRRNNPTCIIQAMTNNRFLVTSRGLSADARIGADGRLMTGSEVWLQSILTPEIPILCAQLGPC